MYCVSHFSMMPSSALLDNVRYAFWISSRLLYSSHRADIFWVKYWHGTIFSMCFSYSPPYIAVCWQKKTEMFIDCLMQRKMSVAFAPWPWTEEMPCTVTSQLSHWLEIADLWQVIETLTRVSFLQKGPKSIGLINVQKHRTLSFSHWNHLELLNI